MSKTILLADDSVTIRKVVELTFMEESYELVSVGTGGEALDSIEKRVPDLLIADVHMPEPGGYEVCRALKEKDPGLPVLLLVGSFEPFDPAEVEACGADAFLKKPFDSQELLQKVEELLGVREGVEEGEDLPAPEVAEGIAAAGAGLETVEGRYPVSADPIPDAAAEAHFADTEEPSVAFAEELRPEPVQPEPSSAADKGLSEEVVEQIARRVAELLSDDAIREVAWEVVPDLAEVVIKDRLRELESQVE